MPSSQHPSNSASGGSIHSLSSLFSPGLLQCYQIVRILPADDLPKDNCFQHWDKHENTTCNVLSHSLACEFLFLLVWFSVHQSQQVTSLNKHLTSIPITVIQVEMCTCCLLTKEEHAIWQQKLSKLNKLLTYSCIHI